MSDILGWAIIIFGVALVPVSIWASIKLGRAEREFQRIAKMQREEAMKQFQFSMVRLRALNELSRGAVIVTKEEAKK